MADELVDDIRRLLSVLDQAFERARVLIEGGRETDVAVPGLHELVGCVYEAKEAATKLFERICARPTGLHVSGQLLSREEFYLIAAQGFVSLEMPWGDAYEVFRMFHYEDPKRRGYINPNEAPRVAGKFKIRLGIPPEEISWDRLRPEQRDFFERHLPEVAARFSREA